VTIIRRSLLKQAGAGTIIAFSRPALLTSTFFGGARRASASGLTVANAVKFSQGIYNKVLGTVAYADARALNFPLYSNRIFFHTYIQLHNYMQSSYPGRMTIISLTDGSGEPRFAINLLPPSNLIPGSTGSNPMLQIFAASDAHATNYFSYVIPNIIAIDGTGRMPWYTLEATVGMLPSSPARWIIAASAVNQGVTGFNSNLGFFTEETGTAILTNQLAPVAFNIPTSLSAQGNSLVFSLGMPITAAAGGYQAVGGPSAYYDTLSANLAGMRLDLLPPVNPDISVTLPQFLSFNTSVGKVMTSSLNAALVKVSTVSDYLYVLQTPGLPISTPTFNGMASKFTETAAALSVASSAAIQAGATLAVSQHLAEAQQYANATQKYINAGPSISNIELAATTTLALQAHLSGALQAANETMANATNLPSISTPAPNTINITSTNTSTGNVVLDGNGSTTTNVATGNVVASSDGSYLNNQVNNVTLQSPQGQAPQQAEQDPYETVESIVITPTLP
jgi:hypothetical protein